jgi:hypothetical protein
VVLATVVDEEFRDVLSQKHSSVTRQGLTITANSTWLTLYQQWLKHVRVEPVAVPSEADLFQYAPAILPVIQHVNDLPPVISAIRARPDWALSENSQHWNQRLATVTGLRIARPSEFIDAISANCP